MKRITLKCRVHFTLRGNERQSFVFEKGKTYEVEDAVAKHAFIKERLLSIEDVKKVSAKKASEKAVEVVEKGAEDVQSASND